ncbi:MAG: hypothetical protein KDA37_18610, partial [Planctomycetales bacterium]|nr:hypothetical protein [Planctomycetales bacterium]
MPKNIYDIPLDRTQIDYIGPAYSVSEIKSLAKKSGFKFAPDLAKFFSVTNGGVPLFAKYYTEDLGFLY